MSQPPILSSMRSKFRVVTAQPDQATISDAAIDGYINSFYLYDLPSHLKLLDLKITYTFYTQPQVDTYSFDDVTFFSIEPPAYVGGIEAQYLQDRTQFFRYWPKIAYKQQVATGDGNTTTFIQQTSFGFFLRSIDQAIDPFDKFKEVVITSQQASGASMIIVDQGGAIGDVGNLIIQGTTTVAGTINYITGAFTVTFPNAPAAGALIEIQYTPYQPARPQSMMFYNNYFTLRPVPDDVYEVVINAFIQPTQLLNSADQPTIQQWWQLLAYGGARTWFVDNQDMDGLQRLQPFFDEQMRLVERRTLQQLTNQRSSTVFTDSRWEPYSLQPPYY